jgi:hypothetical protein
VSMYQALGIVGLIALIAAVAWWLRRTMPIKGARHAQA